MLMDTEVRRRVKENVKEASNKWRMTAEREEEEAAWRVSDCRGAVD